MQQPQALHLMVAGQILLLSQFKICVVDMACLKHEVDQVYRQYLGQVSWAKMIHHWGAIDKPTISSHVWSC